MSNQLTEQQEQERWKDIDYFLTRQGGFSSNFDLKNDPKKKLQEAKVLIIGAGGLGCDLLKNLALSGFKNIHIIDMDTIDISNLNRQFLFREKDVGKSKALVAAEFVNKRVPGVNITAHYCKIQDMDDEFYQQFSLVISGLDSINARSWINKKLCDLVEFTDEAQTKVDPRTVIPFIDGGTEGFKGQARVIFPRISACFECTMDLFPQQQTTFGFCTIANTPRMPEHCVEYATEILWQREKPFTKKVIVDEDTGEEQEVPDSIDGDNPKHIQWIYEKAAERAKQYGIRGVTYRFTQGVVKNIIPAIASTNAVIASACTNEAFKLITGIAPNLDNYMMYNGNESIYTYTFQTARKEDCAHCRSIKSQAIEIESTATLEELLQKAINSKVFKAHINKPLLEKKFAVFCGDLKLYIPAPANLEAQTRPNLKKQLRDLRVEDEDEMLITCEGWPMNFPFWVSFTDAEDDDE